MKQKRKASREEKPVAKEEPKKVAPKKEEPKKTATKAATKPAKK